MPLRLHSSRLKAFLAIGLVVAANLLLFDHDLGLNLGLASLGLLAAVALTNRGVWRSRLSIFAVWAALGFALLQIERATLIGWLLFAVALGVAALAPRSPAHADAGRWALRLVMTALKAVARPWLDLQVLLKARGRSAPVRLTTLALAAVAPVAGGIVFLSLFSAANPLISDALGRLRLPELDFARLFFSLAAAFVAWTALRPRGPRPRRSATGKAAGLDLPTITAGSVLASLVVFNAVFALQNGLDLAFLWSGAPLPAGMSLADYAHRGAYPLIATALLAGLFVLVFLRPGAPTAASRPVRALVMVWIAQNVFLVASTILRTVDYIDAYSLTRMRLAALIWMALVAVGLLLIAYRLARGKSGGWLINANALAAVVALAACSLVDLGAIAADWNVRHAREVGGRGVALDLCHLGQLNGAALVSLARLEQRPLAPDVLDRVRWKRQEIRAELVNRQSDWRAWRWRDARRLARDARSPAGRPLPAPRGRDCQGAIVQPPRPQTAPLTPPPNPRS